MDEGEGILIEHMGGRILCFLRNPTVDEVNESNYREQFDPVVARRRLPSGVCRWLNCPPLVSFHFPTIRECGDLILTNTRGWGEN